MKQLKEKGLKILCGILGRLGAEVPREHHTQQKQLVKLLEGRLEKGYKHLQECRKAEFRVLSDLGYEVSLEAQVPATKVKKNKKVKKAEVKEAKKGNGKKGLKWFRSFFEKNSSFSQKKFFALVESKFGEKATGSMKNNIWRSRFKPEILDGKYLHITKNEKGVKVLQVSKKPDPAYKPKEGGKKGKKGSKKKAEKLAAAKAKAKAGAKKGKKKAKASKDEEE